MKRRIPKEFIRCSDCGEFNGTTRARNLDWWTEPPDSYGDVEFSTEQKALLKKLRAKILATQDPDQELTVSCLCHGPLCKTCGVIRIHGPGTNSYDEETNSIGHWPWFSGMVPCQRCRDRQRRDRELAGD